MIFQIDLDKYYEWEPAPDGYNPTDEEIASLDYKPSANGGWLKKILVEDDSHTAINIPESEFVDAEAAAKRKGKGFNRKMFAAWYIDEVVMRHHAPQHAFQHIHVHDDDELEKLLNQMLVTPKKPDDGSAPSGGSPSGGGSGGGGAKAGPFRRSVASAGGRELGGFSHFMTEVRDSEGRLKHRGPWRHNLTTDTASGYTNRRDWEAKALGGGLGAFFGAGATGNATSAPTATTFTNSGGAFPTTNQGLAGMIVAAGPNASGAGAVVFGVIVSNTATVLTVDQWYNPATGAAGTTPNATASYQILPGQFPAMFLALTSDAGAPAASDTTLASEATTNGFARAIGTWAHTAAASTYTLQKVFNATGSLTVNKEAVFGAANTTGGGVMPFESAEPSPPVLISGDQLTQTVTITI